MKAEGFEEPSDPGKRETVALRPPRPAAGRRSVYVAGAVGGAILVLILVLALSQGGQPAPQSSAEGSAASIESLLQEGNLKDALREVQSARSLFPDDSGLGLLEERINAEMEKGKKEEEARKLERLRRKEAQAKVASLLAEARTLRGTRRLNKALHKLGEVLAIVPDHAEAEQMIAEIRSEIARQETEAKRAVSYRKWMGDGLELRRAGEFEAAAQAYRRAAEYAPPGSSETADAVANCLFDHYVPQAMEAEKKGFFAGAAELYADALEAKEDDGVRKRFERLRQGLEAREALARAEEAFTDGALEHSRKEARLALALLFDEELPDLHDLLQRIAVEKVCRAYMDRARKALAAERWYEARKNARAALRFKPGDEEARRLEAQAEGRITIVNSVGVRLVLVPGGLYKLGWEHGEPEELPEHEVELSSFHIGVTEVTNAQYELFRPEHRKERPSDYSHNDDDPVVHVTWEEAVDFCKWLSGCEGRSYRLPTEAEWEAAARGNDQRIYPWGDEYPDAGEVYRANLGWGARALWARDGYRGVAPAGSFPGGASPFGCLDMCGNVWEWCLDCYSGDYYSTLQRGTRDPRGPQTGDERVLKGGGFEAEAYTARASIRACKKPSVRAGACSFRVVLEGGQEHADG